MSGEIERTRLRAGGFPAIVWGRESESVYIYVHGRSAGEEEAETLARHARRKRSGDQLRPAGPWRKRRGKLSLLRAKRSRGTARHPGLRETTVAAPLPVRQQPGRVLQLLAYQGERFERCLFLSPIVDLERLIRGMMARLAVDEDALREEEIPAGGARRSPGITTVT